jgi:hypothetical protein
VVLCGAVAALGTRHHKAPLIAPALATLGIVVHTEAIDTDALGTFDGRVPRTRTPLAAAEHKARAAALAAGTGFGLGSEGSFFVDEQLPWCTTQRELVTFVDLRTGLVVSGRAQRPAPWATPGTDLRAHRCPERHGCITAAAQDLADRLARRCDDCGCPGVGTERQEPGRPCAWCGRPSLEVGRRIERCAGCGQERTHLVEGPADPGACPHCNP